MSQGLIADLKCFVLTGVWGEEEDPPVEHQPFDLADLHQNPYGRNDDGSVLAGESVYGYEDGSVLAGESVFDSTYAQREYEYEEGSVLAGESVYGSVLAGESVCDSAIICQRGDSSVLKAGSLVSSSASTQASSCGVVAGTTEYFKRPQALNTNTTPSKAAASPLKTSPSPLKPGGPYHPRVEDPIDVDLANYFAENPQAYSMNRGLARISPGHYLLFGREIILERSADKGRLVVRDGPLTQNLADYLVNKDATAEYSGSIFQCKNALQTIPQNARMTFCDSGAGYSRIEAMKVAKEQACTREKAATMMKHGSFDHSDLQGRYQKTIDMKLGKNRTPDKTQSFARSPAGSPVNAMPGSVNMTSPGGRRLDFGSAAGGRSPSAADWGLSVNTPQALRSPSGAVLVPPRVGGA